MPTKITTEGNSTEFVVPTDIGGPEINSRTARRAVVLRKPLAAKSVGSQLAEQSPSYRPFSLPFGIGVEPDGALWFTEAQASNIGRITPSGAIDEFPLPAPPISFPFPDSIITGPDGNLWFTELNVRIPTKAATHSD